jgi:hypothetical protein
MKKYKFRFLNNTNDDYNSFKHFTVGKIYDVYMDEGNAIVIDDIGGKNIIYSTTRFEFISYDNGETTYRIYNQRYLLIK